jgi:DNA primase
LWNHAIAAGPLDTPEQRAGLKQRLGEITEAITHGDVRAHYAQIFRERHDDRFFARKPFVPQQRAPQWNKSGKPGQWKPPTAPATGEAHAIRASGTEAMLLRGVIAGLLRYPEEITTHLEELSGLRFADAMLGALVEKLVAAAMREETVETEAFLTILGPGELYNMAKGLLRADALPFTFTRKQADPDRARRDLTEAIRVMAAGPEIDAALAQATQQAMELLDEASLLQQQSLLRMRADHDRRLADLMQPEDIV